MAIEWSGVEFSGPVQIADWEPPQGAGVYVIMMPGSQEGYYKLIYVGESENLADRGFYRSHHNFRCWMDQAGSLDRIFIGLYLMPNSTPEQRREIESRVIGTSQLPCQG